VSSGGLPQAVLIDMDGLLVDTEPVWTVAEVELARQLGGEFTPEVKAAIVGTRLEVAVPTLLRWYGAPHDDASVARTAAWLLDRMVELFAGPLAVLPGVTSLLSSLADAGIPTALVSSSYRVLVDAVLAHGIGAFDTTLAGDEVQHGKPHPEPYLTAAARLAVDPRRCVVLEDSPSGVASAEAAGCAVVAVPSVPGVAFDAGPRRLVRRSLEGLGLSDLAALVTAAA
jgi:HAD superfamily hydrolase (TIGR01509 family)